MPDVSFCFSEPLAAVHPVAIAAAVLRHNHGPLSTAIGPLPDAAIRAAVRRLYCGPLSAVTIAAAVRRRYHGLLLAAAIADRCSPPLSQTAVRRRYRGLLSATTATGRQLMFDLNS